MTPEEQAAVELLAAACERWDSMPPLGFMIGRIETYALVISCQAMQTHPGVPNTMKAALESIGRQFMERVCDNAEVYAFLESGWNRQLDVTPEDQDQAERKFHEDENPNDYPQDVTP